MSLLHKILLAVLIIGILSSTVLASNSTIMGTTDCPDQTIQSVLMFAFLGIFMLALLWFSERIIRIPFFTILVGIGMLFYSFTLYACHSSMGYMTTAFAIGVVLFKLFWK